MLRDRLSNTFGESLLKSFDKEKLIHNLEHHTTQRSSADESGEIVSMDKSNLQSFLRGVFDSCGVIYFNNNTNIILSIQQHNFLKLERYQKGLQMFGIHSFLYFPQREDERPELFIVGKRNIQQFKKVIGFEIPEEIDFVFQYNNDFDWED